MKNDLHIIHLYILRKDEPRIIARDRSPFFTPVEHDNEHDKQMDAVSTPLLDWICFVAGLIITCVEIAAIVGITFWAWRHLWIS